MSIGPAVRRALGPFEPKVPAARRSLPADLDDPFAAVTLIRT